MCLIRLQYDNIQAILQDCKNDERAPLHMVASAGLQRCSPSRRQWTCFRHQGTCTCHQTACSTATHLQSTSPHTVLHSGFHTSLVAKLGPRPDHKWGTLGCHQRTAGPPQSHVSLLQHFHGPSTPLPCSALKHQMPLQHWPPQVIQTLKTFGDILVDPSFCHQARGRQASQPTSSLHTAKLHWEQGKINGAARNGACLTAPRRMTCLS